MPQALRPSALDGFPVIVTLPIQWGDMDAFGHVNNTVPLRWFESARVVYLEQSGLGHMMAGHGLGPILASVTCHYRRQLLYPDTVHVAARTGRIGRTSMVVQHKVFSEKLQQIAVEGESVVVVFDYEAQRPVRIPDDVRAATESLEREKAIHVLRIEGEVEQPVELSFDDLAALDQKCQITDVSRLDPKRQGDAVTLAGVLSLARPKPSAQYLGLHSSTDDFHASIPLTAVSDRAIFIYRLDGQPLPASRGGPFRLFIPDHAACHTDEIDECANVKFVDRIELTATKGFDNRPTDEQQHERLHDRQR